MHVPISTQNGEARRGEETGRTRLWVEQGNLFEAPKPTFRQFLRWLVRNEYAAVALRIFKEQCGEDVEAAEKNLSKVLSPTGNGNGKRHFDISWLDEIAKELGPEAEEHIVRFICDRYGFEAPLRKPDPIREEERIAKLQKTLTDLTETARGAVQELAELCAIRERGAK